MAGRAPGGGRKAARKGARDPDPYGTQLESEAAAAAALARSVATDLAARLTRDSGAGEGRRREVQAKAMARGAMPVGAVQREGSARRA
jgi:hypothetical protein